MQEDGRIIKFDEINYKIGHLDVMTQFHIARRLAPLLAHLGTALKEAAPLLQGGKVAQKQPSETEQAPAGPPPTPPDEESLDALSLALVPIADALAKMSEEDANYIIHHCLAVCSREIAHNRWAPVQVRGGTRLMFEDIKLPTMIGLAVNTILDNLSDFFPTGQLSSPAAK